MTRTEAVKFVAHMLHINKEYEDKHPFMKSQERKDLRDDLFMHVCKTLTDEDFSCSSVNRIWQEGCDLWAEEAGLIKKKG